VKDVEEINRHIKDGHTVALQFVLYCSDCGTALTGPVREADRPKLQGGDAVE
jgi:hypothetical protein